MNQSGPNEEFGEEEPAEDVGIGGSDISSNEEIFCKTLPCPGSRQGMACTIDQDDELLDEVIGEKTAYVKWVMHFRHPRLGNRLISVRGVSHLKYGEKIEYHEDFYDMGAMLYEQLPVLGNVTRWLKLRLAS